MTTCTCLRKPGMVHHATCPARVDTRRALDATEIREAFLFLHTLLEPHPAGREYLNQLCATFDAIAPTALSEREEAMPSAQLALVRAINVVRGNTSFDAYLACLRAVDGLIAEERQRGAARRPVVA